jgi:serine/threonine protein kinase
VIGEGSYGIVQKALDTQTNQLVAIKTMKNNQENDSIPHFILREYDCLKAMQNERGIISLAAVYQEPRNSSQRQGCNIMFVFPFYPQGDLYNFMKGHSSPYRGESLPTDLALDFTKQILSALHKIHKKAYIHRDLKPANILVGKSSTGFEVVIADFGLSR